MMRKLIAAFAAALVFTTVAALEEAMPLEAAPVVESGYVVNRHYFVWAGSWWVLTTHRENCWYQVRQGGQTTWRVYACNEHTHLSRL